MSSPSSDGEDFQIRQKGRSWFCVLHPVTPRGVDLLCGRRLGALLFQLHDGEAAENADRKLCCRDLIITQAARPHTHTHTNLMSQTGLEIFVCFFVLSLLCINHKRHNKTDCVSIPTGSWKRSHRHCSSPPVESDCHIQRGWSPEAMETLNWHQHDNMEDPESPTHGWEAVIFI